MVVPLENMRISLCHETIVLSLRALSMSYQRTFIDSEFNNKRVKTRKDFFLSRMNEFMLWGQKVGAFFEVQSTVYRVI